MVVANKGDIYLLAKYPQPAILALGTALPRYSISQAEIGRWIAESFGDRRRMQRLVRMVHSQSGIETRYSCLPAHLESPLSLALCAWGRP